MLDSQIKFWQIMIRFPFCVFLILLLQYCGTYFTSNICTLNIDVWYYHAKYVPNICQMAITVTSISDKDDVSCESSNSWYFRVSYLRSMHTSQEHSGLMGFKNFVHKFQDYFAAKIQIIWEVHKILKKISNFVLTLLLKVS